MSTEDPWSALQGAGVVATDAPPEGTRIAYADDNVVGFDPRIVLPDVCMNCGAADVRGRRELRLRLSRMPIGPTERLTIQLPECGGCRRRNRNLHGMNWLVSIILPAGFIAILAVWSWTGQKAAHEGLVGTGALGYMVVWGAAWLYRNRLRAAIELRVLRVDDDGFVKLKGVHPDAAEAVVRSARNV